MDYSIVFSIIAIIVSGGSVWIAKRSLNAQINVSKNSALIAQTALNEQRIADNEELLTLYGIDPKNLSNKGLSSAELVYIWSDLRQGEIFHRIDDSDKNILTEYRKNFLDNQKVQVAFSEFIYGKLMSKSNYTNTIKRYVDKQMANKAN